MTTDYRKHDLARLRLESLVELQRIEQRNYSEPLDYTRAAILRSSIRSYEIDMDE